MAWLAAVDRRFDMSEHDGARPTDIPLLATLAFRVVVSWRPLRPCGSDCHSAGADQSTRVLAAINIAFVVPGRVDGPPDLDNLAEPGWSVLVNQLGWCGGRRPKVQWIGLTKQTGAATGCQIQLGHPPGGVELDGETVFRGQYAGSRQLGRARVVGPAPVEGRRQDPAGDG